MSPKKPPRMFQYKASPGPRTSQLTGVDNVEYYSLSSSDYNSDQSSPRGRPANRQLRTQESRQRFSVERAQAGYRQAVVTCQYKRKHYSEISLDKNTVVRVMEGAQSSDTKQWWRVQTDQGMAGFYPALYLRQI